MSRGKGSQLTALGARLVWAQRRIQARLSPVLDTLASELGTEIEKVLSAAPAVAYPCQSRFAVLALHEFLGSAGVTPDLKYCGSAEALAALSVGSCDVAGFHVAMGAFEPVAVEHYRRWLQAESQRVIQLARRRQGLKVAPGNPKRIYEVGDLARSEVRFINRQPSSGTRYLLDLMLQARGIDPAAIRGYEQSEFTHAAVATFVASGMADAGLGVEVPPREFKLELLPVQQQRCCLLRDARNLQSPDLVRLLDVVRSVAYRKAEDGLAGHEAAGPGTIVRLDAARPSYAATTWRSR